MARPETQQESSYRSGYADGNASSSSAGAGIGVILGVIFVGIAGFGVWAFLGQNAQRPAEKTIINVPSSAPSAPNVNVTIPTPKIEVPSPSLPSQNGNTAPNSSGNSNQ